MPDHPIFQKWAEILSTKSEKEWDFLEGLGKYLYIFFPKSVIHQKKVCLLNHSLELNDSGFLEIGGYQDPSKIQLTAIEVVKTEPIQEPMTE